MPTIIKMPKLSDTMTEGKLLRWNKKVGDPVEMGEILAEVETDKATMEMEAFDDGVVHQIHCQEGDKVPVGAKMMTLLAEGEDASAASSADGEAAEAAVDKDRGADATQPKTGETTKTGADSGAQAEQKSPAAGARPGAGELPAVPHERILKASPLAKKLAARHKIRLERVEGSGPGGRIVRADIERVRQQGPDFRSDDGPAAAAGGPAPSASPSIRPKVNEGDETIELSSMRKIIAERLLASKQQLPHFYLRREVDAGALMSLREQINVSEGAREGGNKYSVNDFILRAVVGAAEAVPAANAAWNGDSIVQFAKVGLAVAISVPEGLVTPVIPDAGAKSLLEISKAVKDLAGRAKDKKLKPAEFDGGTITVSNLGAWGVDHFDAIINPPQAVIVSVGGISKKPVVNAQGEIVVGQRMWLGLSADHRVVDGAVAAELLAEIAKRVEQPALMLV